MWKTKRHRSSQDADRLHDVANRVIELESEMRTMRVEWEDVIDRVTRSYNRLEQAERRAAQREGVDPSRPAERPVEVKLEGDDPFSRKWRQVQAQKEGSDALPHGTDESSG